LFQCKGGKAEPKGSWEAFKSSRRVLLVNDVIEDNGAILCEMQQRLVESNPLVDVQVLALTGSLEAHERLVAEPSAKVLFTTVGTDISITVPWDRSGSYHSNRQSHIFGHGRADPLKLTHKQLEQASSDLATSD